MCIYIYINTIMQIATVIIIPIKIVMIIPIYIYIHNAHSKTYNNTNQHSNKHHIITPMDIIMPMKIRDRPLRHEVWRRSSPGGFVMGIPLYSMGDLQDPKMEVR
jgi:hypothetical protein